MFNFKFKYILIFLGFVLFSCADEAKPENGSEESTQVVVPKDSISSPSPTYFVSATIRNEVSAEQLKAVTKTVSDTDFANLIKYGVKSYTLVYSTTYNGRKINASGIIFVPTGLSGKAPLLSLQHGTTFKKDDAPSISGAFTGVEFFAGAGFISIMPDFIGYGSSKEIFHPYYDQKHSALAVIDMVKSAKEFLNKEKIAFNDKLFLAGYSEGGYVTLAAAKEIEQNSGYGLSVTAMAAGAGGYDLNEMLAGVTTGKSYSYPSYLAFVLKSYNTTYNWNKPMSYFFGESYGKAIDTFLTGEYDGGFINSKLTTDVQKLLEPGFYGRIKAGGEAQLREAIAKNSVNGWKTNIPTKLYHGTKDEVIPYSNSEKTLANFKAAGSTADVSLTLIPGGGHGSSFVPMLKSFVPWFQELK